MSVAICAACGEVRPMDELTAVTPLSRPSSVFYVCRPEASPLLCFRMAVGSASLYSIRLAGREMRANMGRAGRNFESV